MPTAYSSAKIALILAAEHLFANSSIEGASLREVAAFAGQRNHNAVQYHFGTREALVHAVFDYRMQQMEARRAAMLADAKADGSLSQLHRIVEIIFVPQLDVLGEKGGHYSAFLSDFLIRYQGSRFGDFGVELPTALAETLALLREHMPHIPEQPAQRRLLTACFMFLNILAREVRREEHGVQEARDAAIADTIGQIVAAFQAPYAA